MADYIPININELRPGAFASEITYPSLNHNNLYEETVVHIIGAGNLNVSTNYSSYTSGLLPYLAWRMAKNLDNQILRVKVLAAIGDAAQTASIKITVDGVDTVELTTSSVTPVWLTFNVTPTTATTDRAVMLHVKTSHTSHAARIYAVSAYIVGSAPAAGVLASYFVGFDASAESPVGAPISTDYVQRLGDGPIRIAKDRLMTLATVMDNAIVPRAELTTTSTAFKLCHVGRICLPDTKSRDYKISIFQGPGGTTPVSTVQIGPEIKTFSGAGWVENTVTLKGNSKFSLSIPFSVLLKSTDGLQVGIGTVQIRRTT
jgi:hypothetical protein